VNVDPNPGGSKQEERMIILVGRVGDAVKVRGMFVHPNQLFFAARQVPGVKAVQGIVTRPETRDQFTVRVVLEEGTELAAVEGPLKEAVRGACRVSVDAVEVGQIPGDARGMVDGRDWTG
jgi:phenylacetate-CoA ligase